MLTIVCCVESGPLADQTILMVRSLRRFGGALAGVPVIAVIGRPGPDLSFDARFELARLGVQVVKADYTRNKAQWFGYANKVVAIDLAERLAATDLIAWLDSDILIAAEPKGLLIEGDVAVRREPFHASVTSEDRGHEPYFRALAGLVGVAYDKLPWIDGKLATFNSGVVVWRRSSGFARAYVVAFWKLLDSRLADRNGAFFSADQIIIAPVLAKAGLHWEELRDDEHFIMFPPCLGDDGRTMATAQIIHYSKSLSPPHRGTFMARLERERPELRSWLPDNDVRREAASGAYRAILKAFRGLRYRLYGRSVRSA